MCIFLLIWYDIDILYIHIQSQLKSASTQANIEQTLSLNLAKTQADNYKSSLDKERAALSNLQIEVREGLVLVL